VSSLIFSPKTTILEKREERKEKSEKNKKKRQSSVENCRFFLVRQMRLELTSHTTHAPQTCLSAYSSTAAHILFCFVWDASLTSLDYYIK